MEWGVPTRHYSFGKNSLADLASIIYIHLYHWFIVIYLLGLNWG